MVSILRSSREYNRFIQAYLTGTVIRQNWRIHLFLYYTNCINLSIALSLSLWRKKIRTFMEDSEF